VKPNLKSKQGLTLIEIMIALALGMMAMSGFLLVYINFLSHSESAVIWREADNSASMAIERIVSGNSAFKGLREFNRNKISNSSSSDSWTIEDEDSNDGFTYSADDQTISDLNGNVLIENVADSTLSYSNNCINLTIAIISKHGQIISTQEYSTTVQPRNK
jgi:prepilin-type N-terminal cleavage/methylation domain-containing protein